MAKTRTAKPKTQETGNPAADIDRLAAMKIGELQLLFAEVVGEKTRCPNRAWLVKKIVEATLPTNADASTNTAAPANGELAEAEGTGQTASETDPNRTDADVPPEPPSETPAEQPARAPVQDGDEAALAADGSEAVGVGAPAGADPKLSKLDVPTLQALYVEAVGRPTQSSNSAYLIWKIREARRGKVPTGPRKNARAEGTTFKVLPLRMESELVDKLDEAWRRQGLATRMDLFRVALRTYLDGVGETEVAALLTAKGS